MNPPLELCCMTVRQASMPELIEVAAAERFDTVTTTFRLIEKSGVVPAEIKRRCDDAGIRVGYIDGLSSPLPGTPQGVSEERCFELAEELGAPAVNVVHLGGSPGPFEEMATALLGIAERASRRDLRVLLEFLPGTGVPDLPAALDLVRAIGNANLAIMLDTWHLARSGGGATQLTGDAPSLIGGIQVSDRTRVQDTVPYVPMSGRYLPGEGELPLVDILAPVLAAHPMLPIGIEVINDEMRALPARMAAAAAARSLRALIASSPRMVGLPDHS